jgi:hypothetical protein
MCKQGLVATCGECQLHRSHIQGISRFGQGMWVYLWGDGRRHSAGCLGCQQKLSAREC